MYIITLTSAANGHVERTSETTLYRALAALDIMMPGKWPLIDMHRECGTSGSCVRMSHGYVAVIARNVQ